MSRPSSAAAGPLEDDDLLAEILVRLPPLPSSLPRASAVSKRWLGLVSDPRFTRRFRIRHRRNPPLLGCFVYDFDNFRFQPALEAPNRVPECRFSIPIKGFRPLGFRHGLLLSIDPEYQIMVWDSVIGEQYLINIPPVLETSRVQNSQVLRAAGDVRHFQVVLVGAMQNSQAFAYVYSSETGVWGNVITGPLPPDDPTTAGFDPPGIFHCMSSVMIGDSLYWLFSGNSPAIIEFDLARQSLALIPLPVDEAVGNGSRNVWVVPADGGGLGFLSLNGFRAQLWKRKDCDGATSWVLGRTIQLDKLLSISTETQINGPFIVGFAEVNNVVLLWTSIGDFTVHLESLQCKKFFLSDVGWYYFYPYELVYTAVKGIGGGHDGAERLQNA